MTDQGQYSGTHNGTHTSIWTGRQVPNRPTYVPSMQAGQPNTLTVMSPASQARTGLGVIGVLALVIGIILLIASFNTLAAHSALVTLVCGSLLTLIGSIALIAMLAVHGNAKS